MTATHPVNETIGLAFDFDMTLAPGSTDMLLDVLEIDRDEWTSRWLEPLVHDGWDEILARGYALIVAAEECGKRIDAEAVEEAGRRIKPYPGVMEMFDRLRRSAEQESPGVSLDFTILSSGYADIVNHTEVAKKFDRVWGSAFHFDETGRARTVKRTVTHPGKALYLTALSKGLGVEGANSPGGVARDVEERDMRFPVDQLTYVGDGSSDLEAFAYVEERGGLAIAVEKGSSFGADEKMFGARTVENLAPPDFSEGSQLLRSLELSVRSAATRIALRRLSRGQ